MLSAVYRLDWIENLKLGSASAPARISQVSPSVWKLGWTSMLTDISAEMVNSALPAYLVLFLHLNPLQFGVIDGLYHGIAVALLALVAGASADRTGRYKEIAALGYGLSALCKLALLLAGGAWTLLAAITAIDRLGKGARTAPRDALISLHSSPSLLASSFAVHRSLDAGGALLGPLAAFGLLAWLPARYDAVWITSFVFALLGLAVIALLVPNPLRASISPRLTGEPRKVPLSEICQSPSLRKLGVAATLLAITTASDGFLYLVLANKTGTPAASIPVFFVITSALYMIFSMPMGWMADRVGRKPVLLAGYACLAAAYLLLWSPFTWGIPARALFFLLMGIYYASTEGILTAMASGLIPEHHRGSGLALFSSLVGVGKMISSVFFGWLWHTRGSETALPVFATALAMAWLFAAFRLSPTSPHEAA